MVQAPVLVRGSAVVHVRNAGQGVQALSVERGVRWAPGPTVRPELLDGGASVLSSLTRCAHVQTFSQRLRRLARAGTLAEPRHKSIGKNC